jgi:hypothetical protein
VIWVSGEAEYFCKPDWTGQIRLIRLNKFRHARKRFPDPAAKLYVDWPLPHAIAREVVVDLGMNCLCR